MVFFGVGWSGVLRGAGRFLLFFIGFDIILLLPRKIQNPANMPIGIFGFVTSLYGLFILAML
jgi:hypothetical protein